MSDIGPVAPPPAATPATAPASPPAPATPAPGPAVPQQPSGQGGEAPPPPPPPQPVPSAPVASDPAAQISAALRELAQGGQISAQVVARDNAALLVRTAAGATLALNNLAAALEQANIAVLNAALKLQLNPANPSQAMVTQANGAALQPPLPATAQPPTAAQLAIAAAPPQSNASAPPVPPAALPQPGQALPAVVVPPPPAGAPQTSLPSGSGAPLPAPPVLPPGSQLQLVVKTVSLPASAPTTGQPSPAAVSAAAPSVPAALPSIAPSAVAPAISGPAGSPPAPPSTAASTPPSSPPASPAVPTSRTSQPPISAPAGLPPSSSMAQTAPPAPTLISGVVSGQGQAGQVLVSTPQGTLSLSLPQPLPPGTQISFELSALVRPPGPAVTIHGPAPLAGILTRLQGEWPVLQQTLDAVRAADPALALRLQADLLPQPNGRLASAALQFMAAAAIGSAQAWLGSEAVRKLEQSGKTDLLRKLDDDFRELGKLNQRQGGNDWQALVMPMFIGGRIEPIQIFMRRRRDPKRQQQQTRFIIDFDLESTGPIQFDGFVSVKQLDLILRSESEFGPAFRLDVTKIFTEALEITGMAGSIRFHDREVPLAWPSPELEAVGPSTEVKA